MKSLFKAITVASLAATAAAAQAEVSVTAGFMSDYVFRGVQSDTGSGYVSVDLEQDGFYAGVWGADVAEGLEVDFYTGYTGEVENFSYGIGYTRYEYTDNAAIGDGGESQDEISLDLGAAGFGFQYVYGINNDVGPDSAQDDQDYSVYTLTYGQNNWGVLLGMVDADDVDGTTLGEAEYNWAEVSMSEDVAGFSITGTVGVQFGAEAEGVDADSNDGYITFDISKSFDM